MKKHYIAVVRGYIEKEGVIDYALKELFDKMIDMNADLEKGAQKAVT